MIGYKLAKQLDDAGLKLSLDKHRKQWRVNWEVKKTGREEQAILVVGENYETKGDCEEGACGSYLINIPTLSELIEACGKSGFFLMWEDNKWVAGKMHSGLENRRFGNAPEIAVGKLLLVLLRDKTVS